MNTIRRGLRAALATALLAASLAQAQAPAPGAAALSPAQDAQLRKNLTERLPQIPKIDEITRTPMPGLYEVRIGTDLLYTDAEGNFLIQGQLIDTRARRNLTEERADKLMAIDFDQLPVKDAFTVVRGNGKRKLAVFQDPNCGYCKRFERDLQKVDNVTIHMFLYPILGQDSGEKSRNIWCAKDKGKAWLDWMVRDQAPEKATCDVAALQRNVDFGKKHKITGTPTLLFADGTRVPGAIGADQVEKFLSQAK
jgi:thiol:disulfide interchange protein DsbC